MAAQEPTGLWRLPRVSESDEPNARKRRFFDRLAGAPVSLLLGTALTTDGNGSPTVQVANAQLILAAQVFGP